MRSLLVRGGNYVPGGAYAPQDQFSLTNYRTPRDSRFFIIQRDGHVKLPAYFSSVQQRNASTRGFLSLQVVLESGGPYYGLRLCIMLLKA